MRRAKIVATLGPSTDTEEMIGKLIDTGVNVFRMNFSHGSHESHGELLKRIRKVAAEKKVHVAALQDISGPKIRIGEVDGAMMLKAGDQLVFTKETVVGSDESRDVCLTYPQIIDGLSVGDRIFLADGTIKVEVTSNTGSRAETKVLVGGKLTSRKGVNFPGVKIPVETITEKDKKDLVFGAKIGVDIIALSFVRTGEDIKTAKSILKKEGVATPIFAKIEMVEAMENLDSILDEANGIMVARGDLGVEFGLPRVPVAQKEMIKKANDRGLPVITATQMLASMVNSPFPTRAEVSDIANALLDGTDAVMLSDESAVGKHPVEAVRTLVETITETEKMYAFYQHKLEEHSQDEAIAHSVSALSESLSPDGVIVFTTSGNSAKLLAKYRPCARIMASSPDERTLRQLCVVWGVEPTLVMEKDDNSDRLVHYFLKRAIDDKIIDKNKTYILTVGSPKSKAGSTNMIRIIDSVSMEYLVNMYE